MCKGPLCGVGGSAPRGNPKAVCADGMGGPGTGGGGLVEYSTRLERQRQKGGHVSGKLRKK